MSKQEIKKLVGFPIAVAENGIVSLDDGNIHRCFIEVDGDGLEGVELTLKTSGWIKIDDETMGAVFSAGLKVILPIAKQLGVVNGDVEWTSESELYLWSQEMDEKSFLIMLPYILDSLEELGYLATSINRNVWIKADFGFETHKESEKDRTVDMYN